jgi:hypothetical protein
MPLAGSFEVPLVAEKAANSPAKRGSSQQTEVESRARGFNPQRVAPSFEAIEVEEKAPNRGASPAETPPTRGVSKGGRGGRGFNPQRQAPSFEEIEEQEKAAKSEASPVERSSTRGVSKGGHGFNPQRQTPSFEQIEEQEKAAKSAVSPAETLPTRHGPGAGKGGRGFNPQRQAPTFEEIEAEERAVVQARRGAPKTGSVAALLASEGADSRPQFNPQRGTSGPGPRRFKPSISDIEASEASKVGAMSGYGAATKRRAVPFEELIREETARRELAPPPAVEPPIPDLPTPKPLEKPDDALFWGTTDIIETPDTAESQWPAFDSQANRRRRQERPAAVAAPRVRWMVDKLNKVVCPGDWEEFALTVVQRGFDEMVRDIATISGDSAQSTQICLEFAQVFPV